MAFGNNVFRRFGFSALGAFALSVGTGATTASPL
jgi:hypothetical protein